MKRLPKKRAERDDGADQMAAIIRVPKSEIDALEASSG